MRSSYLLRQVLAVIRARHSQRPGELQLRHVVAIQAGKVLIIRARQRLLSLHHFDAVGYARGETLFGTSEIFIGKILVLARDSYLLRGGLQVKKRSTDVVIDLPTQILGFRLALAKARFRFSDVALDMPTGENRHAHPRLKSEGAMQAAKVGSLHSIVAGERQHRVALCASC